MLYDKFINVMSCVGYPYIHVYVIGNIYKPRLLLSVAMYIVALVQIKVIYSLFIINKILMA